MWAQLGVFQRATPPADPFLLEKICMSLDYSITFACWNQVDFTKRCVQSLIDAGVDLGRVIAVDNASTDETADYLRSLPLGGFVRNKENLGCGTAWNQGVLALQTEWSIVMNNDVVVSRSWLGGLINHCQRTGCLVGSPAMIEGPTLDYDLDKFVEQEGRLLHRYARKDHIHAVCMLVHESVWRRAGYFRSKPSLIGYEDALFFRELRRLRVSRATTGASWLHHFGSVTQSAMKQELGLSGRQTLGDRLDPELRRESWGARKLQKMRERLWLKNCRVDELNQFGMTILGHRKGGSTTWV
jgi:glycosyltransferase involved in cell wall biosynthesis